MKATLRLLEAGTGKILKTQPLKSGLSPAELDKESVELMDRAVLDDDVRVGQTAVMALEDVKRLHRTVTIKITPQAFLDAIDEAVEIEVPERGEEYQESAAETLKGIRETVEINQAVTHRQVSAFINIRDALLRWNEKIR